MKDLVFDYTDKNGKEVKLSQNGRSGGIMISEKGTDGKYRMVFSSHSSPVKHTRESLIRWYENEYQSLRNVFNNTTEDYLRKRKELQDGT